MMIEPECKQFFPISTMYSPLNLVSGDGASPYDKIVTMFVSKDILILLL